MSITYEELSKHPIMDRPAILYAAFAEILPRQPELSGPHTSDLIAALKAVDPLVAEISKRSRYTDLGVPVCKTCGKEIGECKPTCLWEQLDAALRPFRAKGADHE